jgi:predicted nucleotidyltransferase component of viral defense system
MNLIDLSTIREQRWQEAILRTANYFGLLPSQIVQDLLNWAFLKTLIVHTKKPYVFKGGTSLSQAFQIIDRFSEDIDLSLQEIKPGYAFRKHIKTELVNTAKIIGFTISNLQRIQADKDYQLYELTFPFLVKSQMQTSHKLKLELMYQYPAYPITLIPIQSFVYRYLSKVTPTSTLIEFVKPFTMNVQAKERTTLDKMFALCDYHIKMDYRLHSRHLYDLHMLLTNGNLNVQLMKSLLPKVQIDRAKFPSINPSSLSTISLRNIFMEIIQKEVYRFDFNTTTNQLLIQPVSYEESIQSLQNLIKIILID